MSGSAAAQEESADEGFFDACLGGLEDADDDYPEVSVVGHSRPDFMHKHGEESNVPHGEDEVLVYVHGWIRDVTGGAKNQAATLEASLQENGYDHPVISAIWSSNTPNWWGIRERGDIAAERLADWLREYRDANPDTKIRLVGHSMGGHVSLEILNQLDGDVTIESVAMLGPSIDVDTVCESGRYHGGIQASANEVHNYHSEQDNIMCTIYRIGEFNDHGLGCGGSDCGGGGWFSMAADTTPDNYSDVDVTDNADGHCSYYRPNGQGCIDQVVDNFSNVAEGGNGGGGGDEEEEDDGGFGSWFDFF